MIALLKLWGIAMVGIGGYAGYRLIDVLFIRGGITKFGELLTIFSVLGLLVSITLVYLGFKLLGLKKQK